MLPLWRGQGVMNRKWAFQVRQCLEGMQRSDSVQFCRQFEPLINETLQTPEKSFPSPEKTLLTPASKKPRWYCADHHSPFRNAPRALSFSWHKACQFQSNWRRSWIDTDCWALSHSMFTNLSSEQRDSVPLSWVISVSSLGGEHVSMYSRPLLYPDWPLTLTVLIACPCIRQDWLSNQTQPTLIQGRVMSTLTCTLAPSVRESVYANGIPHFHVYTPNGIATYGQIPIDWKFNKNRQAQDITASVTKTTNSL